MTKTKDLHRKWRKDPGYQAAYDALEKEFHLARTLIETRTRAGLSQTQLARRMRTSQSYMALVHESLWPEGPGSDIRLNVEGKRIRRLL